MSGANITSQLLAVVAGNIVRASLALPTANVCQVPGDITYPHARSFIRPTPQNKRAFANLLTRMRVGGLQSLLLITGHTDSLGDATLNMELSVRRAQAVRAVLRNEPAVWEGFIVTEGWTANNEFRVMSVDELGEPPSGLSRYFLPGNVANREDLFRRYFARLLGGAAVPAFQTTTPDIMGFGKEQLLRGTTASPGRDPAQPPIQGDFEQNRRSEFFFFRPTPPPVINRADYPTWVGTCSLVPPAPTITVTITPFENVAVGRTFDVQVTIGPAGAAANVSLTISTTSGTGEAQFTGANPNIATLTASGTVTIRGVTISSAPNNLRITATVTGQAGPAAQEDFTVIGAVFIHLQFEAWNLTSRAFEPLPAGVNVDIMDDQGSDPARRLATGPTGAGGRVLFNLATLAPPDEAQPDIFFLVHSSGTRIGPLTLPDWSTKGWLAADNTTPGFHPDFVGPTLGTAAAPVVFRVGLDFHGILQYRVDAGSRSGSTDPSPPRVPVKLMQEQTGPDLELLSLRTEPDGTFHGVSFTAQPGSNFYLHVDFEMQEDPISLRHTRITDSVFVTRTWDSSDADGDNHVISSHNRTSIGTQAAPETFLVRLDRRNAALYQLKVIRELHVFLREITGGAWPGIPLRIFPRAVTVAFSWPPGQVNIPESDEWDRDTIIHETAHQVMWRESNYGASDIPGLIGLGLYHMCHDIPFRANPVHALIEGWAEFVADIFTGTTTPPHAIPVVVNCANTVITDPNHRSFPFGCVCTSLGIPLGPGGGAPVNQGESVEGAFANGLWGVFESRVVGTASASAHVPEAATEQVVAGAPWVRTVRARFLDMIWRPLGDLAAESSAALKSTRRMFTAMRRLNPATWHTLLPQLQAFNMMMDAPTATAIDPVGGPPSGGTPTVTITGNHFTFGTTNVTFDGLAGGNVTVTSSTTLTAEPPPHAVGPVNVVVTTPAGSAAPLNYTYAVAPVISDIFEQTAGPGTSARGPTSGGTRLVIRGTDFHPNARVFFGGPPPNGVEAVPITNPTPTEIVVDTPVFARPQHMPGGVEVVVQNPDQQSGSMNPGFEYTALPAPLIFTTNPGSVSASAVTEVTIIGQNFRLDGLRVFIDNVEVSFDPGRSNTSNLVVVPPDLPAGTATPHDADISIRIIDGQEANQPRGLRYTP